MKVPYILKTVTCALSWRIRIMNKKCERAITKSISTLPHQPFQESSMMALFDGNLISQLGLVCHSKCGALKKPHCSMAMSAEDKPFTVNGDVTI